MSDLKECRAFHWIGQSWEFCDNCGRPWNEHEGLHALKEGAKPFGGTEDDWYTRPWKKKAGTVMVRGRELVVLNMSGQWLAPGVTAPMPAPDNSWTVLRDGWDADG